MWYSSDQWELQLDYNLPTTRKLTICVIMRRERISMYFIEGTIRNDKFL